MSSIGPSKLDSKIRFANFLSCILSSPNHLSIPLLFFWLSVSVTILFPASWLQPLKKKFSPNVIAQLEDYRIEELNLNLILELLKHICRGPQGAILVFLPGIGDISKLISKMSESNAFPQYSHEIYPLHSKLPTIHQKRIFERTPDGIRKIIIATNIAETSITIDDVVYVIDCGKMKYKGLDVEKNHATLQNEWVSKANLRQR